MAKAETIDFPYMNDQQGEYIKDGVTNGNTHNYDYGNVAGVSFDSEGYVNYDNKAYVKKSVKENAETQGLFDVTLDVKGNDINPPRDIDLVLVIDFSSTMSGEKLLNTQNAVHQFLTSIAEVLQEGHVRVGLVCYNRNLYSTQTFSTDANYLDDFLVNGAKSQSGTFTQKGLIEAERMFT
ncbi:vWA domain-containing protein [Lactococcus petauri]|nr:vWA domain-containing protein [Lactococcus petauri]